MTQRESTHLLALLTSFALAGYAAIRLLAGNPAGIATWFVGSAIAHDLVLFPLYAGLDTALVTLLRHHPTWATVGGVRWLNYLRVPAVVTGLLLLVWSPLILRLPTALHATSGLSQQPFLPHWLAITAVLFATSTATLAIRIRHHSRYRGHRHPPPGVRDEPSPTPAPFPGPPASASAQAHLT